MSAPSGEGHLRAGAHFCHIVAGVYTLTIDKGTRKIVREPFHGRNQSLSEIKNRSGITLFENAFARVKIPYGQLPSCFEVKRVEITH